MILAETELLSCGCLPPVRKSGVTVSSAGKERESSPFDIDVETYHFALESVLGIVLIEIMKVQREIPWNVAQAKLAADGVNLLTHAIP